MNLAVMGFVALLIVGLLASYTWTTYLNRNYLISVTWLTLIVVGLAVTGVTGAVRPTIPVERWLGVATLLLLPVFTVLLALKLQMRDNWFRRSSRLFRTWTDIDLPHETFLIPSYQEPGILISGYHVHLNKGGGRKHAVIILAHGGMRSKDIFVKTLLAAWLASRFDVIAFDFRGHGDSSGRWTGDGASVADLKAVVDYARNDLGYKKIGVYGRSMGGWTAVLEAVDYQDVDAIVVAGMPPGYFSQVPEFRGKISLLRVFGAELLLQMVLGVRFKYFKDVRSPIEEISKVAPIPLLILYNETDPSAGVVGVPGHWETVGPAQRERSYRKATGFPFTMQQVYDAAREPKEMHALTGAGHVYSLSTIHDLLTHLDRWFSLHLSD